MTRFVCLDFETTGFSVKGAPPPEWPLPFANYPIQVSVDIVEDGEINHAYDTVIKGARQLSKWVCENVPVTLQSLEFGRTLPEVVRDIAGLLRDGDTIVTHNTRFDLDTVLATASDRIGYDSLELRRILTAPRFCTMTCAYSKRVWGRSPSMATLCAHFEVTNGHAHDAMCDTAALAQCVAEALRRGVMFNDRFIAGVLMGGPR